MVDVAAETIDKVNVVSQIFNTTPIYMFGVILLGFMGGTLSGFIGSGGAFLMTPGMMNLGVPGVMAVAANITHKFGKAMMGSKKHGEMGHVDKKLGIYLLVTACIGIRAAVIVNGYFFEKLGQAGSGLYVSAFFVITLSIIGYSLLRDALRSKREPGAGPSEKLLNLSRKFQFKPLIRFKVANVEVSFVVLLVIGFFVGYMAGTIGVGGFIGVPAMIYIFGVPTVVAAGTELFLAMFMGAWGAFNYGMQGYVDLRLTMLLYAGSLVGIYFGAIGTHIVKELYIRMVTAILILLCVVSRALAIPEYLIQMDLLSMEEGSAAMFELGSKVFLFGSGIVSTFLILLWTFRAKAKVNESERLGFSHGHD
jgi:uncharacterized membrane protein YfcA